MVIAVHVRRARAIALSILFCLLTALAAPSAQGAIVYEGSSFGRNNGLPTDGTYGALTIPLPAAAKPGMVMIVSIAARPSQMNWINPPGWTELSVATEQVNGGVTTRPGGMTMKTFYRIVGTSEPAGYTWQFANVLGITPPYCTNPNPPTYSNCSAGGSAVGGMLVFSGVDTSSSPLDGTPTSHLTNSSSTVFPTTAVTTLTPGAEVVSMISYLSAGSFVYSGTLCGTVERLDVSAPATPNAIGTTLQMGHFNKATPGTTCAPQATASGYADSGLGHLLALKPSDKDLVLALSRSGPLSPGGTASYTMTITNAGSQIEPGPLTIVNTLPAGLTYVGPPGGAGWSCSVSGQTVTCQRSGALGIGASAPPLTINVNVGGSASGVLTYTATASGTGGDGNMANNTAVDTYVIPSQPYAYYALDEATWGSITDSSGNNRHATVLGTASPTPTMPVPPGAALAGSPGTCGAGRIPASTGANGINTGIDVNNLGNAGTIMFWYASSEAWQLNNRILFDASNELGNGSQDKHFYLIKSSNGRLVFALEDSADTDTTAQTVSFDYPANEWHHIAVSWDMAASRIWIYLDGNTTPAAVSTTPVGANLGNMATLYLGAQRYSTIAGTVGGYTSNTTNGYLDEVRLYNRVLDPLEIQAVMGLRHPCSLAVDHYELDIAANPSACNPVPITVRACATSASPCVSALQSSVFGKTANLAITSGGGTLDADATPTQTVVSFDSVGQATGQLLYPTATTGATSVVTLSGEQTAALNSRKCCQGGSCTVANSCTVTFTACSVPAANFNVVDGAYSVADYSSNNRIYTKLAGWNESTNAIDNTTILLDIAALKSDGTIETDYVGSGTTKTVTVQIVDETVGAACWGSPANCSACPTGTPGKVVSSTPVTFGPADLGYKDNVPISLGNTRAYTRLMMRVVDTTSGTVHGCSSDTFAVRPRFFTVSARTSGDAAMASSPDGATGTPTVKAGTPFKMIADSGALGYGRTPEIDTSASGFVDFISGNPATPLFEGAFGAAAPATGIAEGTEFKYHEVGYFVLPADAVRDTTFPATASDCSTTPGSTHCQTGTASLVDCIPGSASNSKVSGKYGCLIGSPASSWGRFIPDHFDVSLAPPVPPFTYSGQPMSVTVTARSANGAKTANYWGDYAEEVTLSDANAASNCSTTPCGGTTTALGTFSGATIPAASFTQPNAGEATATLTYTFADKLTAPLETRAGPAPTTPESVRDGSAASLPLKLRASSATVSSADGTAEPEMPIRSGRLRLFNAYGSELLPLRVEARAEYWDGRRWTRNTADTVTTLAASTFSVGSVQKPSGSALAFATPPSGIEVATGAGGGLWFVKVTPSAKGVGAATLTYAVPAWLLGQWDATDQGGDGNPFDDNPFARLRFGSSKAPFIYQRERY